MQLSPISQAIVLLTVPFGRNSDKNRKCMSNKEWSRFASWLKTKELDPSCLLKPDNEMILDNFIDKSLTKDRITFLLNRGASLSLVLEKWHRSGIWIITRSDPDYPQRLKKLLKFDCPPVIFGCGNREILNSGGLAVVGSRDASEEELDYARALGKKSASQNISIISGGARGIDESAMFGALDNHGNVLGILSDSLLKSAASSKYRNHILSGELLLISTTIPESRFFAANAMIRNKYIYCLADSSVVVSSTPNKGGTWSGAIENLKFNWVPLWVKPNEDSGSGNSELISKGAQAIPMDMSKWDPMVEIGAIGKHDIGKTAGSAQLELNLSHGSDDKQQKTESAISVYEKIPAVEGSGSHTIDSQMEGASGIEITMSFYDLFLEKVRVLTMDTPLSRDELMEKLELKKAQMEFWLKQAVESGKIIKIQKPVRYQYSD